MDLAILKTTHARRGWCRWQQLLRIRHSHDRDAVGVDEDFLGVEDVEATMVKSLEFFLKAPSSGGRPHECHGLGVIGLVSMHGPVLKASKGNSPRSNRRKDQCTRRTGPMKSPQLEQDAESTSSRGLL
jgi:hypothetical protein